MIFDDHFFKISKHSIIDVSVDLESRYLIWLFPADRIGSGTARFRARPELVQMDSAPRGGDAAEHNEQMMTALMSGTSWWQSRCHRVHVAAAAATRQQLVSRREAAAARDPQPQWPREDGKLGGKTITRRQPIMNSSQNSSAY